MGGAEQPGGFESSRDVLEYAVRRERFAHDFYVQAQSRISGLAAREMLKELAEQELKHEQLLQRVLDEGRAERLAHRPPRRDLGIAEYLAFIELKPEATTQDVLIAAIKFEQGSAKFYTALQQMFAGDELDELLAWLVNEEQGHRLRLERLYDEYILTDN